MRDQKTSLPKQARLQTGFGRPGCICRQPREDFSRAAQGFLLARAWCVVTKWPSRLKALMNRKEH